MVPVNFVPNFCFANVVTPGYDVSLFTFTMILSDVGNSSPYVWARLSSDFVVIWLVYWFSIVSWWFSRGLIQQFVCHLYSGNPPSWNNLKYFFNLCYFFFLVTTWYQIICVHTCSSLLHNFFMNVSDFEISSLRGLLAQKVIVSIQIIAWWFLRCRFSWCLDFLSNENEVHHNQTLEF